MKNTAKVANNWHNQSQDKILINSVKQKNASSKKAPPTPGLRRFKTQTRDNTGDNDDPDVGLVKHINHDDTNETSSLAEDMSNN